MFDSADGIASICLQTIQFFRVYRQKQLCFSLLKKTAMHLKQKHSEVGKVTSTL